jgi:hypothetical protein
VCISSIRPYIYTYIKRARGTERDRQSERVDFVDEALESVCEIGKGGEGRGGWKRGAGSGRERGRERQRE